MTENEIAAMIAKGSAESSPAAPPAGTGHAQSGQSRPSHGAFRDPSGVAAWSQDELAHDGSTFRILSLNGTPQRVIEMKPCRQPIASLISPDGGIGTVFDPGDNVDDYASYAKRIEGVLKIREIHAGSQAAANRPAASQGNPSAPAEPLKLFADPADCRAQLPDPRWEPERSLLETALEIESRRYETLLIER